MEDNTHYIVTKSYRKLFPQIFISGVLMSSTVIFGPLLVSLFLGSKAMATTVLSLPLWGLANLFYTGVGYGASTLFTQYLGANDKVRASGIANDSITTITLLALLFGVAGWVFSGPITIAMGTTPELYEMSANYNRILSIALAISMLSSALYFLVNADSRPTVALIGSSVKIGVFIILSFLFIKVWNWGIEGSALALIVAEILSIIIFLTHFYSSKSNIRLKFTIPLMANVKQLGRFVLNFSTDNISSIIVMPIINNLLLANFTIEIVAIYLMLISFNDLVLAICTTTSYTMTPITGVFYGEKNRNGIRETTLITAKTGMVISVLSMILILAASFWIPLLYSYQYESYLPTAIFAVAMFAFSFPFTMAINITIDFFLSVEKLKLGFLLGLGNTLIFPLAMGLIAVSTGSTLFLWLAFAASSGIPLLILSIYLRLKLKGKGLDSFLNIPSREELYKANLCFLISPDEVNTWNDYQEMATIFLSTHSVDEDIARKCELVLGELMEYALVTNQKKDDYVDIQFAILHSDEVRIMVKYNNDIINMERTNDERLLSLQILKGLSKNFEYNRVMSFNTLDMTI